MSEVMTDERTPEQRKAVFRSTLLTFGLALTVFFGYIVYKGMGN